MDERSSQQLGASSRMSGHHLKVETSQQHLFIGGMPVDLKVSLLDDEGVVQSVIQDMHVSVTGEDGKVVGTHPNMFELTPRRPVLLDGASFFQLFLRQGCVLPGNRVKVHVATASASGRGGEQIQADSEPIMVCRSAVRVVGPPPDSWYKDEGGKNNCISIDVVVRAKTPDQSEGQVQPGVPLSLVLLYENGAEVSSQNILQVPTESQLMTNEQGRANLKFKITEVSQRHQSQKFCIKIAPDIRMSPEHSDVAPVVTAPFMVLSKRKNRKIKAAKPAQNDETVLAAHSTRQPAGSLSNAVKVASKEQLPQSGMDGGPDHRASALWEAACGRMGASPTPAHQQQRQQWQNKPQGSAAAATGPGGSFVNPNPMLAPIDEPALRVPTGSTGALQKAFRWTDAVLQLLQMDLQWEHIGYELEPDGTASYARPLFRCPTCRVVKGSAEFNPKHSPDCKLRGLLDEFASQRSSDFAAAILEQQQQQLQQQFGRGSSSTNLDASSAYSASRVSTATHGVDAVFPSMEIDTFWGGSPSSIFLHPPPLRPIGTVETQVVGGRGGGGQGGEATFGTRRYSDLSDSDDGRGAGGGDKDLRRGGISRNRGRSLERSGSSQSRETSGSRSQSVESCRSRSRSRESCRSRGRSRQRLAPPRRTSTSSVMHASDSLPNLLNGSPMSLVVGDSWLTEKPLRMSGPNSAATPLSHDPLLPRTTSVELLRRDSAELLPGVSTTTVDNMGPRKQATSKMPDRMEESGGDNGGNHKMPFLPRNQQSSSETEEEKGRSVVDWLVGNAWAGAEAGTSDVDGGNVDNTITPGSCGKQKAEGRGSQDHHSPDLRVMISPGVDQVCRTDSPATPGKGTGTDGSHLVPKTTSSCARTEANDIKKCAHPGCTKHPIYGVVGTVTPLFCPNHAKKDMRINLAQLISGANDRTVNWANRGSSSGGDGRDSKARLSSSDGGGGGGGSGGGKSGCLPFSMSSPTVTSSTTTTAAAAAISDAEAGAALLLAGRGGGAVGTDEVADPPSESAHTTLVTQFDSSPATYSAEDAGVRLHVRAGSMAEGQVAGPIVIQTDKRLIVECGGSSFLVSSVVDCQPSGSTFDVPLDLDFLVEEELDEQSDDSSEDANSDEYFKECKAIIRNTFKVLQREQSGDPWNILSDEETTVVQENGAFFMRARFSHFSEGCLAKNILLDNAVQTETAKIGRPRKKQLELINATRKTLTFLVLPTTWSNKAIKSLAISVGVAEIGEAKACVERAIEQAVLTEAMAPQVLQVPPMNRQGNPQAGERCTWDICDLPASGGSDARVALVTVEDATVSVWFSRIVKERTRLMVLPGQFSDGMNPQLGKHPLPQGSRCLVSNTFTPPDHGEPMTVANAPMSTISNGSTSVEEMEEG